MSWTYNVLLNGITNNLLQPTIFQFLELDLSSHVLAQHVSLVDEIVTRQLAVKVCLFFV